MVSLVRGDQYGHPAARIVRYMSEQSNPGFLLARTGSTSNAKFWAMFNDAYTEEIDPPTGAPRPDPDPAVRTKRQSLPPTLRSGNPGNYVLGSMFTGQMRTVVQCEFSRGQETKFSHTWSRTHGLLEFPRPHMSGSDLAAEKLNRQRRKYFVLEVSPAGVYAAPVTFGMSCASCALVNEYVLDGSISLNLAAFHAANPTGKVQRVMAAEAIAPAFAQGSPWYNACGWAFSYSGTKAANVVHKLDNSAGFTAYATKLLRLDFSVALAGETTVVSIVRFGAVARVTFSAPHQFLDGDIAAVQGANEDEYNGAHVVTNATALTLDFALNGAPLSPATGTIKVANLSAQATVSASLSTAETGRVIFKAGGGGTIWIPAGSGLWQGISPASSNAQTVSGPVHVFYDGEDEVVTRWSDAITNVAAFEVATPASSSGGSNTWSGNATGTHALGTPDTSVAVVQRPDCEYPYSVAVMSGSGQKMSAHAVNSYGFSGPFDAGVTAYSNRTNNTAVSSPSGTREETSQAGNNYALCGGGNGNAVIESVLTVTAVTNVMTESLESAGGTSSLILFGEEREAVACLHIVSSESIGNTRSFTSEYQSNRKDTLVSGDGPFTAIDIPEFRQGGIIATTPAVGFHNRSGSGTFSVRGAGDFSHFKAVALNAAQEVISARLADFVRFTPGVKETASSDLFLQRGGLYYDEPDLIPRNQVGNRVFSLDGDVQTQGGFEQLADKTAIGFIGRV